ncbi:hypothetical protein HJA91_30685 [Rhizobium binae]|uniref:hypothetical protein n=1 Tax=Rhizobium binae TaxID=1138190 RepID=UPI001C83EA4D|nr:hypothetical protein [Rhizobium binae]MBX4995767.1 hypothetical protein [Rhizobium binae]
MIDELQDMEAGCLMLRKFVRLAIEKDSKDWLLGAMHQLFDSSHDYSRFPSGERLSMGKALCEHILTLCQWQNAHSRAEYYRAMAYFFHEVGNNVSGQPITSGLKFQGMSASISDAGQP